MDKLQRVMKYCIILHNMMVEWREADEGREFSEQTSSRAIVGGESVPVYAIQRVEDIDVPTPGSIEAMYDTATFTRNVGEYEKTRKLVIFHLWDTLGSI